VYPKLSIEAEPPVAVIDKYADKHGTRALAEAYLNFLYTPEGQAIIAKHDLRPRDGAVLKVNAAKFPPIETFTVEKLLGGWDAVQKKHFADGGIFDRIAVGQ
jgi:sulfate transport system substrate-binding protein